MRKTKKEEQKESQQVQTGSEEKTESGEASAAAIGEDLDVEEIDGVGKVTAQKLRDAGYLTVRDVAFASVRELAEVVGSEERAEQIIKAAQRLLGIRPIITALELYERRSKVQKITTGVKKLDELLGGGVETRAITELVGEFGAGKCFSGDLLVIGRLYGGLRVTQLESLFRLVRGGVPREREELISMPEDMELEVLSFNMDAIGATWTRPTAVYAQKVGEVLDIVLENGDRVTTTPRHPFLAITESALLEWTPAARLKEGDYIAYLKLNIARSDTCISVGLDEDDFYVIGLYLADGQGREIFTTSEEIKNFLVAYLEERDGYKPSIHVDTRRQRPRYHIVLREKTIKRLNLDVESTSREKTIPPFVFDADVSKIAAFLAGFFDGDGTASGHQIELPTASRQLAEELRVLLLYLGINCKIVEKHVGSCTYYRLFIRGYDRKKFALLVAPFVKSEKKYWLYQFIKETVTGRGQIPALALRHLLKLRQEITRRLPSLHGKIKETLEPYEVYLRTAIRQKSLVDLTHVDRWKRAVIELVKAAEEDLIKHPEVFNLIAQYEKVIEMLSKLTFYQIDSVRARHYGDYVYDLVVPRYENFVTTSGMIVHNTQFCHQLCVTVQLPEEKGGLKARALYIDTEGTFRPERIMQIAQRFGLDPREALKNIFYARAYNSDHQIMLVDEARKYIKKENIRLIVVDSIIAHFRAEYPGRENLAERQQKLNQHISQLLRLADMYDVAVVVTNQVMANPGTFFGDPLRPAGGNVLAHGATYRIWLRKGRENMRIAKIFDSPCHPEKEVTFRITDKGLED